MLITNLLQLEMFSKKLAKKLQANSIITLSGELGVGKTTLVSYLLKELINKKENFTSPTFNIVHEYYSSKRDCKIFHMDLYRIKSQMELYEIGLHDILNSGIVLMEWPEIASEILQIIPDDRLLKVFMSFEGSDHRKVEINSSCKKVVRELQL